MRVDVTPFADVSQEEWEAAPHNRTVGTALLLENGQVRVWELALGPGERAPFHCHPTTYFYRCETGGRWRLRTIEGEILYGEESPGEVTFHRIEPGSPLIHDFTNVGDDQLRYTTVELLS